MAALVAGAPAAHAVGIVPPRVPAANVVEQIPFRCTAGAAVDDSTACTNSVLYDVDYARHLEGVGPMVLPRGYGAMPVDEQMEVVTNLERVGRGLPPMAGLDPALDADALRGALTHTDPVATRSVGASASIWAGGYASALGADYAWMYGDGLGGANGSCTPGNRSGCWAHRAILLTSYAHPVMGAAVANTGSLSWAAIFTPGPASAPVRYPWSAIPPGPTNPQIVAINPAGAVTGSLVTIEGLYFTGAARVQFGSRAAVFTVDWDGAITARVPPGIGPVLVSVSTARGTTSASFSMLVPPPLAEPIVGMASTPDGRGYWIVNAQGGVRAFGNAINEGSMAGLHLKAPISHIVATAGGRGYWLVAADGGIFAFGDAPFYGSMGGRPLNSPVVDLAPTRDGRGYWLVAGDGGIFAFGDAVFRGSMGSVRLNQAVVGIAASRTGGYREVARDGGIFSFGTRFYGSTGNLALVEPILSMAASADGRGYWFVAADGGIFAFGDAGFHGSLGSRPLRAPIVGMSADEPSGGYWMVARDGTVYSFGAPFYGSN